MYYKLSSFFVQDSVLPQCVLVNWVLRVKYMKPQEDVLSLSRQLNEKFKNQSRIKTSIALTLIQTIV